MNPRARFISLKVRGNPEERTGTATCYPHSSGMKKHASGWLTPARLWIWQREADLAPGILGAENWHCHNTLNEHPDRWDASDAHAWENGRRMHWLTVSNATDVQQNENWRLSICFRLFWVSTSQKTNKQPNRAVSVEWPLLNHIASGQEGGSMTCHIKSMIFFKTAL